MSKTSSVRDRYKKLCTSNQNFHRHLRKHRSLAAAIGALTLVITPLLLRRVGFRKLRRLFAALSLAHKARARHRHHIQKRESKGEFGDERSANVN